MKSYNQSPIKALFNNITKLTKEDISNSKDFKFMLKTEIPKRIEKALKDKKDVATIFEINSSNTYIEIGKSDWITSLEKCMEWYGEDEDYTTCIKLKELVKTIKEKK